MGPPLSAKAASKGEQVLAVWKHGESDTVDLAERFRLTEAEVYHIIAGRHKKVRRPVVEFRRAYAGAAR